MRVGIGWIGLARRCRQARGWGAATLGAVLVAVMIDPGPAEAATIPTPPAVCHPTSTPGTPMMTSFAITSSVDVTSHDKRIRVTIEATDATQDISALSIQIESPRIAGVTRFGGVNLDLLRGTSKDGTWTGTTVIPRWTNNGTWEVTQVGISDVGGGFAFYFPTGGGGTYPWNMAWPQTFEVQSTHDVTPPTVTAVKLSRGLVDTSKAVQRIYVSVKAKDSRSGVQAVTVDGSPNSHSLMYRTIPGDFHLRLGNAKNGTWKGSIVVPRWVGAGTHFWTLSVGAYDFATNGEFLQEPELKAKKLTSRFRVRSLTDNTSPVLRGLAFSPTSVDARNGNKTVKATLQASDSQSGIDGVAVTLRSPSGASSVNFASAAGLSGLATIKLVVRIPQCSEPGRWTVSIDLYDFAGNLRHYTTAQVKAKNLPSTLSVQALDTESPNASAPITVDPADSIPVTFTEPTLWKDATAQTALTFYDPAVPGAVTGTWTCANAAAAPVTCDADGANVKVATFAPSAPLMAEHGYEVRRTPGSIFDTSGNSLDSPSLPVTTT